MYSVYKRGTKPGTCISQAEQYESIVTAIH